jgi:hypothetical protein
MYAALANGTSIHLAFEAWPASNAKIFEQYADGVGVKAFAYADLFGRSGLFEVEGFPFLQILTTLIQPGGFDSLAWGLSSSRRVGHHPRACTSDTRVPWSRRRALARRRTRYFPRVSMRTKWQRHPQFSRTRWAAAVLQQRSISGNRALSSHPAPTRGARLNVCSRGLMRAKCKFSILPKRVTTKVLSKTLCRSWGFVPTYLISAASTIPWRYGRYPNPKPFHVWEAP